MFQRIIIYFKNLIRHLIYRLYRTYKNNIELKLPIHELQTIDIIQQLPKDAICIDIGVNEGQIFKYLNKRCKKGKIIGFEPVPVLASYLKSTYKRNNIKIYNLALADVNGVNLFYYFPERTAISSLRNINKNINQHFEQIIVQVRKLDDVFNEQRLDFIKIDVEGAELLVLKGAQKTIENNRPLIVFEAGPGGLDQYGHSPEELFIFFSNLNYKISAIANYARNKLFFSREDFTNYFYSGTGCQFVAFYSEIDMLAELHI